MPIRTAFLLMPPLFCFCMLVYLSTLILGTNSSTNLEPVLSTTRIRF
uniref:Uncharacterized protein n=1 Tax=Picea glauca TaxID=3330 RepID=A0A117NH49_PICGL|nr:hypothetical protein ABT39_MTgene5923 [Picea glauca]